MVFGENDMNYSKLRREGSVLELVISARTLKIIPNIKWLDSLSLVILIQGCISHIAIFLSYANSPYTRQSYIVLSMSIPIFSFPSSYRFHNTTLYSGQANRCIKLKIEQPTQSIDIKKTWEKK